jgi:hypothetical protein
MSATEAAGFHFLRRAVIEDSLDAKGLELSRSFQGKARNNGNDRQQQSTMLPRRRVDLTTIIQLVETFNLKVRRRRFCP